VELFEPVQLSSQAHSFYGGRGLHTFERAEKIGSADDADEFVVSKHRDAAVLGARHERLELGKRRVFGGHRYTATHDPAHGRMRQVMPDRLVEILPADAAHDSAFVDHEDATLPMPLAERHRMSNGVVGRYRARRSGHDVACTTRLTLRLLERVENDRPRLVETQARDGRCRLRMSAPAQGGREHGCIDSAGSAAGDCKDAAIHLDEHDERAGIREVDDLVSEVRDALHILRPVDCRKQDLLSPGVDRLEHVHQPVQQIALGGCERRVQVGGNEILARAVAKAPREGVGIALGARRIRERARVLMYSECERRCLKCGREDLALGEDPDERRRQRSVCGSHSGLLVYPFREPSLTVMVEQRFFHGRIERDRLELAEPRSGGRLDHDQPSDGVEFEPPRLRYRPELVRVQAVEVADIAIERTDCDDSTGVQKACSEHRRERVEVRVPVGGDDLLRAHELILPRTHVVGLSERR